LIKFSDSYVEDAVKAGLNRELGMNSQNCSTICATLDMEMAMPLIPEPEMNGCRHRARCDPRAHIASKGGGNEETETSVPGWQGSCAD
jgi:hypothetical protein